MKQRKQKPQHPTEVETELGRATVGVVTSRNAWRVFKCPLCDGDIEEGEEHLVVVPVRIERLRRHTHTECLINFHNNGYQIKLHPNEPHAMDYYTTEESKQGEPL